jgi:hypothetical protein
VADKWLRESVEECATKRHSLPEHLEAESIAGLVHHCHGDRVAHILGGEVVDGENDVALH